MADFLDSYEILFMRSYETVRSMMLLDKADHFYLCPDPLARALVRMNFSTRDMTLTLFAGK